MFDWRIHRAPLAIPLVVLGRDLSPKSKYSTSLSTGILKRILGYDSCANAALRTRNWLLSSMVVESHASLQRISRADSLLHLRVHAAVVGAVLVIATDAAAAAAAAAVVSFC